MTSVLTAIAAIISIALFIIALIFLYKNIIPKKYDGTFSKKTHQNLHDYFNFKTLYIEHVLKFLFVVITVAWISLGIFTIISSIFNLIPQFGYVIEGWISLGTLIGNLIVGILSGIAIAVLGSVAVRLSYEGIMLFILLVKNVIEINNKTK